VDDLSRIAVVTGAGSGIGRAVALGMLEHGYAVVLAGRRVGMLSSTAEAAGPRQARAVVVPTDVADPASVHRLFESVRARFGRVDLLFNNAGVAPPRLPIDEVPIEAWRAALDVNLTGAFLCTQHAVALMKAQRPRGGRTGGPSNNTPFGIFPPRRLNFLESFRKSMIS
jgi:NAD(P)-dependent dehydrogenase (short-subunit alcohol dehydrogenase family)